MKTKLFFLITVVFFTSCKVKQSITLKFIDEYILKDSIEFQNTIVGGISGIDYHNGSYHMVVDDSANPRVLKGNVNIDKDTISAISFSKVIYLKDTTTFYKSNAFDLESVFVDEKGSLMLTSEGSINYGKNPLVFSVNSDGKLIDKYKIPSYFKADLKGKPRHNATFEASCRSINKEAFWVAMEGVLEIDGEEPSLMVDNSPSRITLYDTKTKQAIQQFAYPLDKLENPFIGRFNVNGITAILEYEENSFFVVERAYQSGYGLNGNVVKIYKVNLNDEVTNTLDIPSLKNIPYTSVKKELIFNFDDVRHHLTNRVLDNIEGITLGPKLSNGNQSLLLVSDDNFRKFGKQLNQFILLEINK